MQSWLQQNRLLNPTKQESLTRKRIFSSFKSCLQTFQLKNSNRILSVGLFIPKPCWNLRANLVYFCRMLFYYLDLLFIFINVCFDLFQEQEEKRENHFHFSIRQSLPSHLQTAANRQSLRITNQLIYSCMLLF